MNEIQPHTFEPTLYDSGPYRHITNCAMISLHISQRATPGWSLFSGTCSDSVHTSPVTYFTLSGKSLRCRSYSVTVGPRQTVQPPLVQFDTSRGRETLCTIREGSDQRTNYRCDGRGLQGCVDIKPLLGRNWTSRS